MFPLLFEKVAAAVLQEAGENWFVYEKSPDGFRVPEGFRVRFREAAERVAPELRWRSYENALLGTEINDEEGAGVVLLYAYLFGFPSELAPGMMPTMLPEQCGHTFVQIPGNGTFQCASCRKHWGIAVTIHPDKFRFPQEPPSQEARFWLAYNPIARTLLLQEEPKTSRYDVEFEIHPPDVYEKKLPVVIIADGDWRYLDPFWATWKKLGYSPEGIIVFLYFEGS